MDGWLDTFLDKILIVFFAIFGGAARFAIAPPVIRSMWGCVGSLIIAGFAGILTWQLLEGLGFSTQTVAAGVGIAGLLGDDLLKAILKLGVKLREDPLRFVDRFLRSKAGVLLTTSDNGNRSKSDGRRARRMVQQEAEDTGSDMDSFDDFMDCTATEYEDESVTRATETESAGGNAEDAEALQQYRTNVKELRQRSWELVDVYNDGTAQSIKTTAPARRPRKLRRHSDSTSSTLSDDCDERGRNA